MVKQNFLTKMLLLCALIVGSVSSAWATDVTITFGTGTGAWAAHSNASYTDSDSRTWSCTYSAGGKSSGQAGYSQFGNSSNACTSLEFTATAGVDMTVTAFSVTMAGASGSTSPTKGTIYLYKRTSGGTETQLATATVSGTEAVTCEISSNQSFSSSDILKVSYVGTAKAIRISQLKYSYTETGASPYISADDVNIGYDSTGGDIAFTVKNGVTGGTISASTEDDWITLDNETTSPISFTCSTNSETTARTATVTLTYTYNTNKTVIKDVTVTQAAYVAPPTPVNGYYVKVTSTDNITDGQYLIVYEDGAVAFDGGLKTLDAESNTIAVTIENEEIAATTAIRAAEFTIDVTAGTLQSASGKYIGVSSNSNGLKTSDDAETYTNAFSIDENENAVIAAVFEGSSMTLRFNSASGQNRFRYYKDNGQKAIQLYKFVPTATITLNAACTDGEMVFGTYSNSSAFVVSEDIVVSEISIVEGKLHVVNYQTGAIVPANTGVMVSALEGGDYEVELSSESGNSVLGDENCLLPSGDGITAEVMAAAAPSCKYYRLTMHGANNQNPGTIGFWWGAEYGAAFALAANKAYLAVPSATGAPSMGLWIDDDTTGIQSIERTVTDNQYYTLDGRRIAQPTKGLYIVNGRKVIVK